MSLLADSSPPTKMPSKRLSENSGCFDSNRRHSNFKHRKLDAVRSFPANCGPTVEPGVISLNRSDVSSSINITHSKMDFARDFAEHCAGISACKINKGESLEPVSGETNRLTIPAVPLRCVPPADVKMAKDSYEESWEHDFDKMAATIAEAKNYLNVLNVVYSTSKRNLGMEDILESDRFDQLPSSKCDMPHKRTIIGEPKPLMETPEQEEGVGEMNLSECDCGPIETNATIMHSDINIEIGVEGNNEPKDYDDDQKDLINLSIMKHEQPQGVEVMKVLKLFEKYYKENVKEQETQPRGERKCTYFHLEAAQRLKKEGKYISPKKPFGHIPGIKIGDEFRFRSQLAVVGLHRQLIAGIDHVVLGGNKYATSVVDSGRYENTAKSQDILIYSGQGGNLNFADNSVDQKLERGNLALMNSMEKGYPVRVTYKRKSLTGYEPRVVYVYDGLYTVHKTWQERDQIGKLVFKFELHRMLNQPRSQQIDNKSEKVENRMLNQPRSQKIDTKSGSVEIRKEVCMVEDISQGKEKIPIRAMNNMDDDSPPPFTYITRMVYPYWYNQIVPVGCDCVKGCSDSHQCPCVVKNGGEIPYTNKGAIMRRKPRVHECGPSCKCPPTCTNRVSQLPPRFRLELFKTEKRGWGVRSRDPIPSGGFICEYLGELLRDKEADLRVNDEYLFDIYNSRGGSVGFAIDSAMYGNIGRFINHSCSPNLYAQNVLYDHDDKRMPRLMFFATEDIPPLQELCYHYNYKLGKVCDPNGNVKTKDCYCGSRKCTKRMY
ncbi:hypothetical protein OROGR_024632 [Orobanche gracilis]